MRNGADKIAIHQLDGEGVHRAICVSNSADVIGATVKSIVIRNLDFSTIGVIPIIQYDAVRHRFAVARSRRRCITFCYRYIGQAGSGNFNPRITIDNRNVQSQIVGLEIHGVVAVIAGTPSTFLILIENRDLAVVQLGQAGIHELAIIGSNGDRLIALPGHGIVAIDIAHKNLAVQARAGAGIRRAIAIAAGGAGNQNDLLAVHSLGIGDCGNLGIGVGRNTGIYGAAPAGTPGVVHIVQLGIAVAVEEAQRAVVQLHNRRLGAPASTGEVRRTAPSRATIYGVNEAHLLTAAASVIAVNRENDLAVGHQTAAGADKADLLGGHLDIRNQSRLRPCLAAVGRLGQVQIARADNLIRRIREEQVGVVAISGDVEISIHGVAGNHVVAGIVDLAVLQIIIIGRAAVCRQLQRAITIEANGRRRSGIAAAIQSHAVGIQIAEHIDCAAVRSQSGIDESSGATAVVCIAVIAQIVSEGIIPVRAIICGIGNDGIQSAAVIGGVPAGVRRSHYGAIIQGHHGGNAEAVAATGTLHERIA